jgi:hypothetical protein
MRILCDDYVDLFECTLDFHNTEFKLCSKPFSVMGCVALSMYLM